MLVGVFEVIPQEFLSIFTEDELTTMLEGEKSAFLVGVSFIEIDVHDWRQHTVYTNEFSNTHPVVQSFWATLECWDTQQQSLLLSFATGYAYPPV